MSEKIVSPLERVHEALRKNGSKQKYKEHLWSCPVCEKPDQLSVQMTNDNDRVMIYCFRKCRTQDVLEAIGLKWSDIYDNSFFQGCQFEQMLNYDEHPDHNRAWQRYEDLVTDKVLDMRIRDDAKKRYAADYGQQTEPLEFMGLEELDNSPVSYRIENLMPMGANILLSAPAKTGKTTFILDMIRAMTTTEDFLGSVSCSKTAGTVVYLNLELDERMLRSYALQNGLALGNKSLKIVNLRGKAGSLNLLDENHRKSLADQLKAQDCEVLVVDPLSPIAATRGIDSDNNDQMRQLLEGFSEVGELAGLENLVIVDHTGHEARNRARGASAKLDWPDVLWNIQADGDARKLTAFGRGVDNSVTFARSESGRLVVSVPRDFDGGDRRAILDAIQKQPDISTKDLKEVTKLDKSILSERLRELEGKGEVVRTPGAGPKPDRWNLVSVEASTRW